MLVTTVNFFLFTYEIELAERGKFVKQSIYE